jgi:hypothetical protein
MQENLSPELPLPARQAAVRPAGVPMPRAPLPPGRAAPLPPGRAAPLPPGRAAPLPDPVAMRRVAIPDAAPPYDDEPQAHYVDPQATADAGRPPLATSEAGLAAQARPDGAAGEPKPADPTAGQGEPGRPRDGERASPGPRDPQAWPSQFAQVLAETLAGSRPATQLRPWTTEQTRQRIRQLGPVLATGQRPRVRRIMTSAPSPDVLEMTAVVGFGSRVRVLALRLERGEEACQHWRCTAIESA